VAGLRSCGSIWRLVFGSAAIALHSGGYTAWVLLSFLDLISCAWGIIGLVRLAVFDLGINRSRVRVPLIVSDLVHLIVVDLSDSELHCMAVGIADQQPLGEAKR
jgi:hypothetical protein